jgi:acyl carrier protein
MVDEEFGLEVSGRDLAQCVKVKDLLQFVNGKLEG